MLKPSAVHTLCVSVLELQHEALMEGALGQLVSASLSRECLGRPLDSKTLWTMSGGFWTLSSYQWFPYYARARALRDTYSAGGLQTGQTDRRSDPGLRHAETYLYL